MEQLNSTKQKSQEELRKLRSALTYAGKGVRVFPLHWIEDEHCSCGETNRKACSRPGEHPRFESWQDTATSDPEIIEAIWSKKPRANVGVLCGKDSNLTVINAHGIIGLSRLRLLEQKYGKLPPTPRAITESGGVQILFAYVPGLTNAVRWGEGLDLRTESGLIVGVGSVNADGGYLWVSGSSLKLPRANMPQWLIDEIRNGQHRATRNPDAFKLPEHPIAEGKVRAGWISRLGWSLRAKGMPNSAIRRAVLATNKKQCLPPLNEGELELVLAKVLREPDRQGFTQNGMEQEGDWPDPQPVVTELLSVPPLDAAMLPSGLKPWLLDIAERQQCPLDFVAIGAIVAASTVVGRSLVIRPKREDDWQVAVNLWGAAIGHSGVLKSPALAEALVPINRLRAKAEREFRAKLKIFKFNSIVTKAQTEKLEKAVQLAVNKGSDLSVLRQEHVKTIEDPPVEKRYVTNDTTVEKLGELLNENDGTIMVFRDELSGFLKSMERRGHENDRAFYLEAWNGTNTKYDFDRIGRGTLHIAALCVSILGGIQPNPLKAYLFETFADGRDDGFIQRFQLMAYPDIPRDWKNIDRKPNAAARDRAIKIFEALDGLNAAKLGAARENGPDALPYVRFTDAAQDFFDEWREKLELRLRSQGEHPLMTAHLAKYRSLMPSLALLFELIHGFAGFAGECHGYFSRSKFAKGEKVVSKASAKLAADWCTYLEAHARRVYQSVTFRNRGAAAALAKKIRLKKLPNPFTARQVYNSDWTDLSDPDAVYRALEVLEDSGWIRMVELKHAQGGRPTIQCQINPKIYGARS